MKVESTSDQQNPSEDKIKLILELFNSNRLENVKNEIDKNLLSFPRSPILFNILGAVFAKQNKIDEALLNYKKSIKINPNYFQAYNNLGACMYSLGKIDEAIQNYQQVIKLEPNHADAHNNLGAAYKELGENEKAIKFYEKAIEIQPNHADAHNNLGAAYKELGENEKAIKFYEKAIEIQPNHADALNNLGSIFKELKEYKKSIYNLEKAIKINPKFYMAYSNLGNTYKYLGDYEKAIDFHKKALEINSKYADGHFNLGTAYDQLGEFEKAQEFYKKAITIDSSHSDANSNLLFNTCWLNNNNEYLKIAQKYNDNMKIYNFKKFDKVKISNKKTIKIGFISGDFRHHSVIFFLVDTFKYLKEKEIQLFIYNNNSIQDNFTKLIKKYSAKWTDVFYKTNKELISIIRKDNLNILFDLSGHTANNRLNIFKNRCAQVQVSWCGWLASTGVKEIDYIIGDIYATPLSDQNKFSEKIYQLKNIWQSLSISNSDFNVPFVKNNSKENIVLGSLASCMRLNDSLIKIWSSILNKIPNSKLILRNKNFAIPKVRRKFIEKFDNNKINKNQLVIDGQSFNSKSEYLEFYNKIDIILDTFPASGVTTSFDASYMGVPILTKIHNKSFWFRSGESINMNLNMEEWIAKDENDYIKKTITFSENKNYLIKLKSELRNVALKSPLFDTKKFNDNFYEMLLSIK